ncbi:hypothetical protein O181_005415 [Austropuccinia psidii MF-1]|uniref:Uncharacterized protein n=1 Tax=Austropuccinia psidii MF-1 TaxID=1389203 RepID=A0A9Q3GFT9_9BASI|nr:hypothetical protein [Austropuccinia psidii MF-1]
MAEEGIEDGLKVSAMSKEAILAGWRRYRVNRGHERGGRLVKSGQERRRGPGRQTALVRDPIKLDLGQKQGKPKA